MFRTSLPLSFTLTWECSQNKILGLRREGRTQDWLSLKRDSCPGLGRMTFRKVSAHSTAQSVSPSIEWWQSWPLHAGSLCMWNDRRDPSQALAKVWSMGEDTGAWLWAASVLGFCGLWGLTGISSHVLICLQCCPLPESAEVDENSLRTHWLLSWSQVNRELMRLLGFNLRLAPTKGNNEVSRF